MSAPGSPAPSLSEHDADRELLTGEAVALDLRATNVVLRGAGAIIDTLVYVGGTLLLAWLLITLAELVSLPENLFGAVAIITAILGLVIVPAVVETATRGRSLGRLALGDRIVRDDGGAIAFRHAFIRSFVGLFEIVLTFGGLAVIVAMLNPRAKRLGDLLAGTYSQYERVPAIVDARFGMPVELQDWALTADVARMPDPLARRIAQFLAQASGHTPATRERLAQQLAADSIPYISPVPAVAPELLLAGVAVLRRERESRALELERARLEQLQPTLAARPHGFPERG
ncbi:RDD family protein [Microcella daejeonensis]|uniref:RDD family protein n=1 Tax=Microcella daejeonensis TaxID=2994971 RepID=A0A9E8MLJ7_9MICO|nr:RDD family protein [Microcella daejeonensis]WAB81849.1 RDD family protein [Microcella daejeonensis]WAB84007.1 RDD family protein [Microcella daejeonensis]